MSELDVICLGEALVDFLPEQKGRAVHQVESWRRCSGGSLANVSVGLSRLGARSAMVGVVGDDEFGLFLAESLRSEGVDVSHLRRTAEGKTGLVFISLTETGERSFAFFRTRAAEFFLAERDVDPAFLARARALHFGTNSLLWDDAQRAVARAAREAKALGKIVSCDPNLRLNNWPDPSVLRRLLDSLWPSVTVAKLAEDEIEFVCDTRDPDVALDRLARQGVRLAIVTRGAQGARFQWKGLRVQVPTPVANVVDTTGAGDGFVAGLLFGLTRRYPNAASLEAATPDELAVIVRFACEVGARACEQLGAVTALPRRAELEDAIRRLP